MAKMTEAMYAYVMSDNPEQVHAAAEQVNADRSAGKRVFGRDLTPAEQRRAGMPPPSQRQQPQGPVTRQPAGASEISRIREASDIAEQRYSEAFNDYKKLQDALEELESDNGFAEPWSDDPEETIEPIPEDEIADRVAAYNSSTDNPLSQAAVDAMDETQRNLFIRAGAQTAGVRAGTEWKGGSAGWQAGETVDS